MSDERGKRAVIAHLRKEAAKRSSGRPVWAIYFCGRYHTGTFSSRKEAMATKAEIVEWDTANWPHGDKPHHRRFCRLMYQVERVMVLAVPKGVNP